THLATNALSLHDALPISVTKETPWTLMMAPRKPTAESANAAAATKPVTVGFSSAKLLSPPGRSAVITTPMVAIRIAITFGSESRSEEHTSELQSRSDLVC